MSEPVQDIEDNEDIEIYKIDDPNMPDYMKELADIINSKPAKE